jgi:NAD/NADP transhydrogenase alpha subunit
VVFGFDVRPVVREQVESLGAKFLDLGIVGEETEGGYARELTDEEQRRQQDALEERIPEFDVVITTAAIPGRPAPRLIPAGAVRAMKPGSVIVDLAAETGGNCELTKPGEEVVVDGVSIIGLTNVPSTMPTDASRRASARFRGRDHRRCVRDPDRGRGVTARLVAELTVFALAIFVGFEVISKVPTMLHTPLMSGTNAIHGIVLIGAMLIAGTADSDLEKALAFVAVVFGTINVVGGFLVTDRMLEMFKQRRPDDDAE